LTFLIITNKQKYTRVHDTYMTQARLKSDKYEIKRSSFSEFKSCTPKHTWEMITCTFLICSWCEIRCNFSSIINLFRIQVRSGVAQQGPEIALKRRGWPRRCNKLEWRRGVTELGEPHLIRLWVAFLPIRDSQLDLWFRNYWQYYINI